MGFILAMPLIAWTQQSIGEKSGDNIFLSFQEGQFRKVIRLYEQKEESPKYEILYYISQLKTGIDSEAEITNWIHDNSGHLMVSLARFNLAASMFYKGAVSEIENQLKQVDYHVLAEKDQAAYGFIYGLTRLEKKAYSTALELFLIAEKNGFHNLSQLAYYQGYSHYFLDRKKNALEYFKISEKDPEYELSSRFFRAKILLELGMYDEAIVLSEGELNDKKSVINSGFYHLIGEAYALKNDPIKADTYLEQAINVHPERPSAALYYQAGTLKFKLGNQSEAINYLTKSGVGAGSYAQLSAYQLGKLYVRQKSYEKALSAFQEATAIDDPAKREQAIYQSAKLSAKLEKYTEAIKYAQDYQTQFPTGQWKQEMQNLIAESYLKTSNYNLAISHLEEIGLRSERQKAVYQKVTYQKAALLFNDGNFDQALSQFRKSLKYPEDLILKDKSLFYCAEIMMQMGRYSEAIENYRGQSAPDTRSAYGIAYAYYNERLYEKAIPFFERAARDKHLKSKEDATLRLADCFYATKSYQRALDVYKQLSPTDYMNYQIGLAYKGLGKIRQAANSFHNVSNASRWKDDALYHKGLIEFEIAAFENAEASFTELINNRKESSYIPQAYLNRAISRTNAQSLEEAKRDYQHILEHHIGFEVAFSAILGLQELAQKGADVGNIDPYIEKYRSTNPKDGSLELIEFESAKADYFNLSHSSAIPKLESFFSSYPESKFSPEAGYYLGDSYFRAGLLQKARDVFEKQKMEQTIYTARMRYRLGAIHYQLGAFKEAIENYQFLLELNSTPKDNYNALAGLMDSHFALNSYSEAIEYASQIISAEWKPVNADRKALYVLAKSQLALDQAELAKKNLNRLSEGFDQFAAEARYITAKMLFESSEYDAALDALFNLADRFGSYTTWVEQSYLLIAEIYMAKGELFQAKATLRSIIQHSRDDAIQNKAQNRLNEIEGIVNADTTQVKE